MKSSIDRTVLLLAAINLLFISGLDSASHHSDWIFYPYVLLMIIIDGTLLIHAVKKQK